MMKDNSLKKFIDRAHDFNESLKQALEDGKISEEEWYKVNNEYFTSHYLAADNPRAQSGHSGSELHYFHSHAMLIDVINKDGSFIDVGCANGYLLESLERWVNSLGYYSVTWYGLDISDGLINLAKQRLPDWSDQFFVGNAVDWIPDKKYDFVCVKELSYAVPEKQQHFFEHLIENYVSPSGRLIIGPYSEESNHSYVFDLVASWGYPPSGYIEKSNHKHKDISRKLLWWDIS